MVLLHVSMYQIRGKEEEIRRGTEDYPKRELSHKHVNYKATSRVFCWQCPNIAPACPSITASSIDIPYTVTYRPLRRHSSCSPPILFPRRNKDGNRLTLNGFEVWISCGNDTALPQYNEDYDATKGEATCWIPPRRVRSVSLLLPVSPAATYRVPCCVPS